MSQYGWVRELKWLSLFRIPKTTDVPIWIGARVETVMDAAEWNLPVVPIWIKRELKYYIQGNQEKAIPIWIGLE